MGRGGWERRARTRYKDQRPDAARHNATANPSVGRSSTKHRVAEAESGSRENATEPPAFGTRPGRRDRTWRRHGRYASQILAHLSPLCGSTKASVDAVATPFRSCVAVRTHHRHLWSAQQGASVRGKDPVHLCRSAAVTRPSFSPAARTTGDSRKEVPMPSRSLPARPDLDHLSTKRRRSTRPFATATRTPHDGSLPQLATSTPSSSPTRSASLPENTDFRPGPACARTFRRRVASTKR